MGVINRPLNIILVLMWLIIPLDNYAILILGLSKKQVMHLILKINQILCISSYENSLYSTFLNVLLSDKCFWMHDVLSTYSSTVQHNKLAKSCSMPVAITVLIRVLNLSSAIENAIIKEHKNCVCGKWTSSHANRDWTKFWYLVFTKVFTRKKTMLGRKQSYFSAYLYNKRKRLWIISNQIGDYMSDACVTSQSVICVGYRDPRTLHKITSNFDKTREY